MAFASLWTLVVTTLVAQVFAQSKFIPTRPPSIPLAVKSPYLSIWTPAGSDAPLNGNGGYLAGQWPVFWAGQIVGWAGLVRVDGKTYTWMGHPVVNSTDMPTLPPVVQQNAVTYSATRTIFDLSVADKINMTVTFFSYHDPEDLKRQSFPFSYLNVDVSSLDGQEHDVQLYTDISAEIISGDRNNVAQWSYGTIQAPSNTRREQVTRAQPAPVQEERRGLVDDIFKTFGTLVNYSGWRGGPVSHPDSLQPLPAPASTPAAQPPQPQGLSTPQTNTQPSSAYAITNNQTGGVAYHKIFRQTQQAFSENSDQTEFGYWYWVTKNDKDLTHQSGPDGAVRLAFVNQGHLNQTQDTRYRPINKDYPVFAYSKNLGKVGNTVKSTLFGLALAQEYSIQFEGKGSYGPLKSLYTQFFSKDEDAVCWFYDDYATALSKGIALDQKIQADASAAGGKSYATVTTLAYRQVNSAYEITGTTDNPLVFQKEISSNGNMNTADVIFPAMPLFLYRGVQYIKYVLEPLFIQQEAGKWPYQFALHDIGSHFPNATGHADGNAEQMPIEESGNMIIMSLAYARKASDTAFLKKHYDILRQWAQYLVSETLIPADQISTDDFASSLANQTNLALKGIIAIAGFGEIAKLTGYNEDASNFTSIAQNYIQQWEALGINKDANPPHSILNYNNPNSHGLLYNLFADRLLDTQLVPQSIYEMQSNFYPTQANLYGVPLDTRGNYTKSDWECWCAAIASPSTAKMFYDSIALFIKQTPTEYPFSDLYETQTADFPSVARFVNRPVQGGTYARLALGN